MSVRTRLREGLKSSRLARFAMRGRVLARHGDYAAARPREAARFLFRSREISNFTYELDNRDELVACVATALDSPAESASAFVSELESDAWLFEALRAKLQANRRRDPEPRYGYRSMYYCVARVLRPETIVEIGTHDGLGAAVLLRALERNAEEGDEGRLISLDTAERSGWLIPERLRGRLTQVLGEAAEQTEALVAREGCDFLIDDIGFAYEGKRRLFEAGLAGGRRPLVLASEFPRRSDDVAPRTALAEVAAEHGARYAEFDERPRAHFWPGHAQALARFA